MYVKRTIGLTLLGVGWCLMGVLSGLLLASYDRLHTTDTGTSTVIAIDLGTKHSSVGLYQDGHIQVIKDKNSQLGMPPYVCFKPDGELLIGEEAKQQQNNYPNNTIYGVKRIIGRFWEDPVVQKHSKMVPYTLVNIDGHPYIEVKVAEEIKHFSPEEICAIIVKHIKERAEEYLGKTVTDTVVSVPVHFNNAQRNAMKDICNKTGLIVKRLINVPTAAAIAYGFKRRDKHPETVEDGAKEEKEEHSSDDDVSTEREENKDQTLEQSYAIEEKAPSSDKSEKEEEKDAKNVLVCHLGEGNFDVSLISINDGVFEVHGTDGDPNLGGDDFTLRTSEHFTKLFKTKHGNNVEVSRNCEFQLYEKVEKAQIALSSVEETEVYIKDFSPGTDLNEQLSRKVFKDIHADKLEKIKNMVQQVVGMKSGMDMDVVIIGESAYIADIGEEVDLFPGKKPIQKDENENVVIEGAVLQGAKISNETDVKNLEVYDVVPLTLGLAASRGKMSPVVERNTRLPANNTKTYITARDNQTSATIEVFEGQRPIARYNNPLGVFEIMGIPPAIRASEKVNVTFIVDLDGILNVSAIVNSTGEAAGINIEKHLNKSYVDEMLKNGDNYAEKDAAEVERLDALIRYEDALYSLRDQMQKLNSAPSPEVQLVIKAAKEGLEWLEEHEDETTEVYRERHKALTTLVNDVLEKFNKEIERLTKKLEKETGSKP